MKKLLVLAILLLGFETSKAQQWDINGNLGILPFHFVGSINNAALNFGTNNLQRMTIRGNDGFIGMNNTAPIFNLTIGANGPYPPNPGPYPDGGIIALGGINLGSEKLIFEIS